MFEGGELDGEVADGGALGAGTECSTVGNFAVQLATLERTPGPRPTCVWAARLAHKQIA